MAWFCGIPIKQWVMIIFAIALIVVLFFVIRFVIGAAKKKSHGQDLGDSQAGT
jgi:phosphotransferase system  glucose/maltose/N-acetylglucosamine-specific IIC component